MSVDRLITKRRELILLRAGGGVCKDLSHQNTRAGEGREASARWMARTEVRSCSEKKVQEKLWKRRSNFPTVANIIETKFGQVVLQSIDFTFCLSGCMKAKERCDSSTISKTSASVSSRFPNTRKQMKARGRRPSAFIVFECLEIVMKHEARVFEIAS